VDAILATIAKEIEPLTKLMGEEIGATKLKVDIEPLVFV
jgi:hypothetical protein